MPVSIVAEGGGIRGAYVFGAVEAIRAHYGLQRVDIVAGCSASAGSLAYYAAGQFYLGRSIWVDSIPSPHFISAGNLARRRPFLDIDYMIDVIFKKLFPLDPTALKSSPVRCIVPVESYSTGRIEYIDVQKSPFDIFEVLRAANAAPIVYNKLIELGDDKYFDAYFTEPLPLGCEALHGSRKIIVLSKPRARLPRTSAKVAELWRPLLAKRMYRTLHEWSAHRNIAMDTCDALEKEGDIIIAPAKFYGSALDNSRASIEELFLRGYEDAVANEPLRRLMTELQQSARSDFYFPPTPVITETVPAQVV